MHFSSKIPTKSIDEEKSKYLDGEEFILAIYLISIQVASFEQKALHINRKEQELCP